MDVAALKWYRENSSFTENSVKAGQTPITYFNMGNPGKGFNFRDRANLGAGMGYYGTPAEYNASYQAAKYLSVSSPPNEGKVFFIAYPPNPNLTTRSVFPGNANNDDGKNSGSPFHLVKLYFAGRTSLSLDTKSSSSTYKTWS
tara:strand:+ start:4356 stop:4784 length:429 start_codon:yes stop_codon:yes gene_type:complete